MTVNHDVVGSSPTGGVFRGRNFPIFFDLWLTKEAPLAQLDRVPDYESGG